MRTLHRRIGEAHRDALRRFGRRRLAGRWRATSPRRTSPSARRATRSLAGDAARGVYADHEAIDHYRRARTFLRRLNDPGRERDTLFKIALVRHLAFDYVRAGQAYDAAFDCSSEERTERAPTPSTMEIALVRPDSYAPGDTYSSESAVVIEQLFRGLLRIDHDLNVVPELAQNMNVSADGLTYLFMLRENACWSDGHPLTAGDFVYAWRKLREEGHVTASCSTTSPRPRRSTTGRSMCICGSPATTSPTCSPHTGRIRGRATAPTRSELPGAGRSRSSATGRSCSRRSTRRAPA